MSKLKSKKSSRKSSRKSRKSIKKSRKSSRKNSKKSRKSSRKSSSIRRSSYSETIILRKSKNPDKKYAVTIGKKTINFGAKHYSDFTIHKDKKRMHRYENRHRSMENWTKSGIKSAGFWSKWILWNKPSLLGSISDTRRRFGLKIINKI